MVWYATLSGLSSFSTEIETATEWPVVNIKVRYSNKITLRKVSFVVFKHKYAYIYFFYHKYRFGLNFVGIC